MLNAAVAGPVPHLGILYSCAVCGLDNVEVGVRYRLPDEDVVEWMRQVVEPALSIDHLGRSPYCNTDELKDVKIPVPAGTQRIGGPVEQ